MRWVRRVQKTINSALTQFQYDGVDAVTETSGGTTVAYLRTLGIDDALVRTEAVDSTHYLGDHPLPRIARWNRRRRSRHPNRSPEPDHDPDLRWRLPPPDPNRSPGPDDPVHL
jgi:hypothetical protein